MSEMEEISYWVHTKRAPCLYNYDNQIKRQLATLKPASALSDGLEVPTPKKKTKRKLSLFEDSASPEKQQNVYFETSQQNQRTVQTRSDSDSDINFNIKNSSIKPKRIKLNNRTTVHKKNKVVTSTPKTETTLRRSQRRAQRLNNNVQMHSSFNVFNNTNTTDKSTNNIGKKTPQKCRKSKNDIEKKAAGDHNTKISIGLDKIQNNGVISRQLEEVSDVSGFTANYIRSTKVQATNTSRKLRSKGPKATRNTPQLSKGDMDAAINCVNKSKPEALNYSTSSSQNVLNFITTKNTDKNCKIDKGTSLLKFVDTSPNAQDIHSTPVKSSSKVDVNISFESQCSRGRYPRRHKVVPMVPDSESPTTHCKSSRLRGKNKSSDLNDRKENPDESCVSRTRSGRSIGLALRRPDNSVQVYNISTEQISSGVTVNVADCSGTNRRRKSRKSSFRNHTQRSTDQSDLALRRDTTRERSGFAACFSDSDQDSECVKPRKFFA